MSPAYIALWSRLRRYQPQRLSTMVESRELVRTALVRSMIHLVTPDDCLTLRPLVQPVLDRDLFSNSNHGAVVRDLDLDAVVKAGLDLLDERPRTPGELGKAQCRSLRHYSWSDASPQTLGWSRRCLTPLRSPQSPKPAAGTLSRL